MIYQNPYAGLTEDPVDLIESSSYNSLINPFKVLSVLFVVL
jgi:hypothetical protein